MYLCICRLLNNMYPTVSLCYSHYSHMVLWLERDLQHFGPVYHPLHAGRGDGLPGDAVDLVEGVGLQDPLVSCSYEDLQPQWSCALVPTELNFWMSSVRCLHSSSAALGLIMSSVVRSGLLLDKKLILTGLTGQRPL